MQLSLFSDYQPDENSREVERLEKQRREKEEGRRLRDEGIALVMENAGDDWKQQAAGVVRSLRGREVTGEGVRRECTRLYITPHHSNAWGGFVAGLVRSGVLQATGKYTRMSDPNSHARKTEIYLVV